MSNYENKNDSKYKSEFVDSWAVKAVPEYDFIAAKIHVKAEEFVDFLRKHKEHIKENNGFCTVDILWGKSDPNKMYAKFTKLNKQAAKSEVKEVKASEFMPDREFVKEKPGEVLPF